ncbi:MULTISPECIES: 16S rRNA (guanine(527)-N(7))-methyltransferase RsmG [unclassified Ruegeria]|uniref:16S rRNA (guanine(527)-N(7))-methyltransferase RsmG n=1 Tax=unclassified Ruegeria TaxID=2625375 RepID=UPI00148818D3|nr:MULTISPECIES: 16S rRNA (guanine(527)-N(7))-methyltransferase RsmG [unclassified Ruegeria]NOE33741.1 16S rRNA (guanine(527)-N(7))-methyltransferase RsmG [Ruegeria sp. HKCCD7318]
MSAGYSAFERLNVSRETFKRLKTYVDLVNRWNPKINLVSRSSLEHIWDRHILDSVQVYRCAGQYKSWVDIGSGGGFPGMVCALIAADHSPDSRFTFVESDQRKSAFLRNVARECEIKCKVISKRIESVDPLDADVLSARALAELRVLLSFCDRHLSKTGTALLPKGATWKKELSEAQEEWNFDVEPITSLTEPQAVILKIKGVSRG